MPSGARPSLALGLTSVGPAEPREHVRLCYAAAALAALLARLLVPTVICDDAYITLKTSLSLARGDGLIFNPGQQLYVTTTPLWALLLGGLARLGLDVVLAARLAGAAAEIGLALAMVKLGQLATGRAGVGLLASLYVVTNPVFVLSSTSGMELPVYLLVITGSLGLALAARPVLALALAGASIWLRPDGVLLLAAVAVFAIVAYRPRLSPWKLTWLLPPLLAIAAYAVFGHLVFQDVLPTTVQRKVGGVAPLSREWLHGASMLALNLGFVAAGMSLHFVSRLSPFLLSPVLLPVGLWRAVREKQLLLALPLGHTALHAGALVLSGHGTAVNFPWYFVPATVGLALLGALGLEGLVTVIADRFAARRGRVFAGTVAIFAALSLWAGYLGAVKLEGVAAQRERPYASVARWIGARFPQGARVGANEIGAVGFFAPKQVETVDIYGLLRKHEDRALGSVDMVAKYRPEALVVKKNFDYRETIERSAMGPQYTWFDFKGVSVGLRRDVAPPLLAAQGELHAIYEELDLLRQPPP